MLPSCFLFVSPSDGRNSKLTRRETPSDSFDTAHVLGQRAPDRGHEIMYAIALQRDELGYSDCGRQAA